jgi:hypothetical protein
MSGETLEDYFRRLNLDETRRKILENTIYFHYLLYFETWLTNEIDISVVMSNYWNQNLLHTGQMQVDPFRDLLS